MKIYVIEEMFWDDCDGHNIKLLDLTTTLTKPILNVT
jgi:hypothetical protein